MQSFSYGKLPSFNNQYCSSKPCGESAEKVIEILSALLYILASSIVFVNMKTISLPEGKVGSALAEIYFLAI